LTVRLLRFAFADNAALRFVHELSGSKAPCVMIGRPARGSLRLAADVVGKFVASVSLTATTLPSPRNREEGDRRWRPGERPLMRRSATFSSGRAHGAHRLRCRDNGIPARLRPTGRAKLRSQERPNNLARTRSGRQSARTAPRAEKRFSRSGFNRKSGFSRIPPSAAMVPDAPAGSTPLEAGLLTLAVKPNDNEETR